MFDPMQADKLKDACGLTVMATEDGNPREITIVDSSDPSDTSLGAPNEECASPGPGEGDGGEVGSDFENCDEQGNLMVIDGGSSGCLKYSFMTPVRLVGMGLLDIQDSATITVSTC